LAIGNDVQWQSFCTAFDLEPLAKDEKYRAASDRALRMPEFFALLASITAAYDVDVVVKRLLAVDVPVAPVLSPDEVRQNVQVVDSELIRKAFHPDMGEFLQPRAAANMFGVSLMLTPAPAHGEHSKEILQELGHKLDAINDLIDQGVIFTP
jgi:crotonobetainyl-CoA:carnitine CoA-transferase CaiB-like acyl-CoA transferase